MKLTDKAGKRIELTDRRIEALEASDTMYKVSDRDGLVLRVQPSGSKLWQFAFRFGGKPQTLSLGAFPTVSLADARDAVADARRKLRGGINPQAEHLAGKAERRAQASGKRFADYADAWLAKQRADGDAAKTLEGKTGRVAMLKATFGKRLLSEITRSDVLDFLRTFETGKQRLETRDRARANGENIFAFAADEGVANPFARFAAGKLVKKKKKALAAAILPADVARILKIIAGNQTGYNFNEMVALAIRFQSLTALRVGPVACAEWAEIDLDQKLWVIPGPKMKMKDPHIVPLSRQAIAILERARALNPGGRYIFSTGNDKPLVGSSFNRRLRALGINTGSEHSSHGFRSMFSTLLNDEVDRDDRKLWDSDLIELQLAHRSRSTVRGIYNRTGPMSLISARARMMQAWADKIDTIVSSGDPVALRKQERA
jgi:integrase